MLNTILWCFFIYAALGWCIEVIYAASQTGEFVNRGFLNGPYCPYSSTERMSKVDNQISSHAEQAMTLFKGGYNCAQAVVGAFCDETGIDFETAIKLSSSFGGGMGRLREVCGAVSGMFMVAGLMYGFTDPLNKKVRVEHYKLIQALAKQFKEENGSIICRELSGLSTDTNQLIPESRKGEYNKKRSCLEIVGQAAEMMDELIKNRAEELSN